MKLQLQCKSEFETSREVECVDPTVGESFYLQICFHSGEPCIIKPSDWWPFVRSAVVAMMTLTSGWESFPVLGVVQCRTVIHWRGCWTVWTNSELISDPVVNKVSSIIWSFLVINTSRSTTHSSPYGQLSDPIIFFCKNKYTYYALLWFWWIKVLKKGWQEIKFRLFSNTLNYCIKGKIVAKRSELVFPNLLL